MSGIRSTLTDPLAEHATRGDESPLEQALRKRRVLAWLLSAMTLTLTIAFFAMMTLAAPRLSRVVLGHSITLANVLAVSIIITFLLTIAIFSAYAARVDVLLQRREPD